MYWSTLETTKIASHSGRIQPQFVACFDKWEEKFAQITGPYFDENQRYTRRLEVVKESFAMDTTRLGLNSSLSAATNIATAMFGGGRVLVKWGDCS